MKDLVDVVDEPAGNSDHIKRELTEAVTARAAPAPAKTEVKTEQQEIVQDLVPDKYRGKSIQDVIAMHQNLESAYGRMANDLGTQRKWTDHLLDLKRTTDLQTNGGAKLPQVTSSDLLEKPAETLDRYTAAREEKLVSGLKQEVNDLRSEFARERFVSKHPDHMQLANDAAFVQWVQQSPYRARAAMEAYRGDWVAADELLSEFKAARPAPATRQQEQQSSSLKAAKEASLESNATSSDAGSKPAGKTYRRADLIKLMATDPESYYSEDFQREIILAHAQGRVK